MPSVNFQHKLYQQLVDRWKMVRDAVEGEAAVKAAGTAYLPKLTNQDTNEYEAYRTRALFFEATRRTLSGLVGMVMRKEPAIEAKDTTKEVFLKTLTKDGLSLNGFASVVMAETLMLNKYGILADLPEQISATAEPWLVGYTAESMINWEFMQDADGKTVLQMMVLQETWNDVDPEDRFKIAEKDQWRVLELVDKEMALKQAQNDHPENPLPATDPGKTLIYRVQVWRRKNDADDATKKGTAADEFMLHENTFPTFQGKAMDVIPFTIVTAEDEDKENQKPPLEGLASVNMSHYRTSADLEHGRHFTALPTPYVVGLAEQSDLSIGSSKAWVISGVNASEVKIGMLEFTGSGLSALETGIKEKQAQMAILGARLLEEQKKAAEAFETHSLRAAGEQSVLATVANGVSEGLNEALSWMTLWDATLGDVTIQLNTEFTAIGMDPQLLTALIGAVQASRMSFKAFYFNLQQRGMYPEGHTEEDELGLIEMDKPEPLNLDNEDGNEDDPEGGTGNEEDEGEEE